MMARSTNRSKQRPDTLMQDRNADRSTKFSCDARPDHTSGSISAAERRASWRPVLLSNRTPIRARFSPPISAGLSAFRTIGAGPIRNALWSNPGSRGLSRRRQQLQAWGHWRSGFRGVVVIPGLFMHVINEGGDHDAEGGESRGGRKVADEEIIRRPNIKAPIGAGLGASAILW